MIFLISFHQNRLFSVFVPPECGVVEGVDALADEIGVFCIFSQNYLEVSTKVRIFAPEQWTCSIIGNGVSPFGRVVRFVAALFLLWKNL